MFLNQINRDENIGVLLGIFVFGGVDYVRLESNVFVCRSLFYCPLNWNRCPYAVEAELLRLERLKQACCFLSTTSRILLAISELD